MRVNFLLISELVDLKNIPKKSTADPGSSLGGSAVPPFQPPLLGPVRLERCWRCNHLWHCPPRSWRPRCFELLKNPWVFEDVFFWGGTPIPKNKANGYQGWERAGVINLENRVYYIYSFFASTSGSNKNVAKKKFWRWCQLWCFHRACYCHINPVFTIATKVRQMKSRNIINSGVLMIWICP